MDLGPSQRPKIPRCQAGASPEDPGNYPMDPIFHIIVIVWYVICLRVYIYIYTPKKNMNVCPRYCLCTVDPKLLLDTQRDIKIYQNNIYINKWILRQKTLKDAKRYKSYQKGAKLMLKDTEDAKRGEDVRKRILTDTERYSPTYQRWSLNHAPKRPCFFFSW